MGPSLSMLRLRLENPEAAAKAAAERSCHAYREAGEPHAVWLRGSLKALQAALHREVDLRGVDEWAILALQPDALRPRRVKAGGQPGAEDAVAQDLEGGVIILSKLIARRGRREALFAALEPFMQVADTEPGTLVFTLYESFRERDAIWMFEAYTDSAAYRTHVSSPLHQTLRERGALTGGRHLAEQLARPPENRFLLNRAAACP